MARSRPSVREIVVAGLLVAVSVVLTRLGSITIAVAGVQGLRLSFGPVPLYMAGILAGPLVGGLAGVAADILGMLLFPTGGYFPGFTLSSALTGLIPGLIAHRRGSRGEPQWPGVVRIFVAILVTNVVVSLGLNPVWLSIMYNKAWKLFTTVRFLTQAILIPTYTAVVALLVRAYIGFRNRM